MKDVIFGKLPPVLKFEDGSDVTPANWKKRRAELYKYAVDLCYGGMPPKPDFFEVKAVHLAPSGKKQSYVIKAGRSRENSLSFRLAVYRAPTEAKTPVLLSGDDCWQYYTDEMIRMWQQNGFTVALFDRTEIANDLGTPAVNQRDCALYEVYPGIKSGTIAGWAWAISLAVEALCGLDYIDSESIAVAGHSRGGKAALLAAATDERIKYVNFNGSGCGGAGCFKYNQLCANPDFEPASDRCERISDMFKNFENWLSADMKAYIDNEAALPFDQHFIRAMIAPRLALDTEGLSDTWANPIGTYQTYLAAKNVYKMLGAEENCLIRYRKGPHFYRLEDAALFCNAILHSMGKAELSKEFTVPPFDGLNM